MTQYTWTAIHSQVFSVLVIIVIIGLDCNYYCFKKLMSYVSDYINHLLAGKVQYASFNRFFFTSGKISLLARKITKSDTT